MLLMSPPRILWALQFYGHRRIYLEKDLTPHRDIGITALNAYPLI